MFKYVLPALCCLLLMMGFASLPAKAPDPSNATYKLGRDSITLVNGRSDMEAAPGSAIRRVTTLLKGSVAYGDVTGDGQTDAAVVLVDQPGGTGSFYYLAVLPGPATAKPSSLPAVFLGDRIRLRRVTIARGKVTVAYLDRRRNEPMAAPPTVKVTKTFTVRNSQLVPAGTGRS